MTATQSLEVPQVSSAKSGLTLFKNALSYSGLNLVGQFASSISGFALRRLLVPELMGVWNMAQVVRSNLNIASLGFSAASFWELPILRGRGDHEGELRCRSVCLIYSVGEAAVVALCLCGYALWKRPHLGPYEFYALLVTAAVIILSRVQDNYANFFNSAQAYIPLSRSLLACTLVYALALPLGAALAGLPGLLAAALFAEGFRAYWMYSSATREGLGTRRLWDWAVWKRLAGMGVVLQCTNYPYDFAENSDLLWVTTFVGIKGLAIYALAKNFYTLASEITIRVCNVLALRTLSQHGEGVGRHKIGADILRGIRFQLLVSVPAICWAVGSAAPLFIRQFVPKYAEGIPIALTLLLTSFFLGQNANLYTSWIAQKRMWAYGTSNALAAAFIGSSMAASWHLLGYRSLLSVSIAFIIGYSLYFAYMIFTAGRELWGLPMAARVYAEVIGAALWTAGVFAFLSRYGTGPLTLRADLLGSAVSCLRMFLAMAPLVAFGFWVSDGVVYVRPILRSIREKLFDV